MADWDEHEHPRHPAKAPKGKGGEFRPKGTKAVRDLATLSRSTLLKYARERGLTIPRGHPDDSIRQMIRRFDSGTEPGWIAEVGKRIEAKKAPAKKAPKTELVPSSITKPGTFRVIHNGVEIGTIYVDPRGDGSAHAFPPDDGGPGLAPAPTWKRTQGEAIQVLIDAAKKAPVKKTAAPKKTAVQRAEAKVEDLKRRLDLATERRKAMRGSPSRVEASKFRSKNEVHLSALLRDARAELAKAKREEEDAGTEAMRRELAAENDAEFGGEAELERNFRLSGQDISDALAPPPRRPLQYGAQTIVLDDRFVPGGQKTRFGAFLNLDTSGDYGLSSGYYGVNPPEGAWSVETGFSPLGRDMAYWGRVRDNLVAIDQFMAGFDPRGRTRLSVRFNGDEMVIMNYDTDRVLTRMPAR